MGNMKLHGEIEALENMGVNINDYLVAPRIIGACISQLAITVYFTVIALLTGILISTVFVNTTHLDLIFRVADSFTPYTITIFVLKNLMFGYIIGSIACYNALRLKNSATELPQRTTAAIIQSLSFIFVIDGLLTFAVYT
jgi:phospholipid/cholesterol/gamma-HCH transport system permease protein